MAGKGKVKMMFFHRDVFHFSPFFPQTDELKVCSRHAPKIALLDALPHPCLCWSGAGCLLLGGADRKG